MADAKSLSDLITASSPVIYAGGMYAAMKVIDKGTSGSTRQAVTRWIRENNPKSDIGELTAGLWGKLFNSRLTYPALFVFTLAAVAVLLGLFDAINASKLHVAIKDKRDYEEGASLTALSSAAAVCLVVFILNRIPKAMRRYFSVFWPAIIVVGFGIYVLEDILVGTWLVPHSIDVFFGRMTWDAYYARLAYWPGLIVAMIPTAMFAPIFLLAVVARRFVKKLFDTTISLQKYMEKGNEHPFEAAGWVLAGAVFSVTAVVLVVVGLVTWLLPDVSCVKAS